MCRRGKLMFIDSLLRKTSSKIPSQHLLIYQQQPNKIHKSECCIGYVHLFRKIKSSCGFYLVCLFTAGRSIPAPSRAASSLGETPNRTASAKCQINGKGCPESTCRTRPCAAAAPTMEEKAERKNKRHSVSHMNVLPFTSTCLIQDKDRREK